MPGCDERRRRHVKEHVPYPPLRLLLLFRTANGFCLCRRRVLWTPNRLYIIIYYYIFFFLALCSLGSVSSDDSGLINVLRSVVVVVVFNLCRKNKIKWKKKNCVLLLHTCTVVVVAVAIVVVCICISCISIVVVVYC